MIDLDRVALERDELGVYFAKIEKNFQIIRQIYDCKAKVGCSESAIVSSFTERLFRTFLALRLKYLYTLDDIQLKIDTTDSGFVHHYEISHLEADLANKAAALMDLPSRAAIKADMVDEMVNQKRQPEALLALMSKRCYFESLDADALFLSFNHGTLTQVADAAGHEVYSYYWSCYDAVSNIPYIYIMVFESSYTPSLSDLPDEIAAFKQVVKTDGGRAPNLNVVAASIDDRLEHIHPKILKRIRLGPFYSRLFSQGLSATFAEFLECGDAHEQFALKIEQEVLFSMKQVVSKAIFSRDKLREIYFVPDEQLELYEKGVSSLQKYMIMPYKLHQHATEVASGYKVISFDKQGVIHGL